MKKLLAILTFLIIIFSPNISFACDNWPNCSFSNEKIKNIKTEKNKKVKKKKYYDNNLEANNNSIQSGMASYYWQPQRVACGGKFNPNEFSAAHKTLPCGSKVVVTNKRNGKSIVVTINDRGPYVAGRIIDLSRAAASAIGMVSSGTAPVTLSRM